jgi:hypothetical protein
LTLTLPLPLTLALTLTFTQALPLPLTSGGGRDAREWLDLDAWLALSTALEEAGYP